MIRRELRACARAAVPFDCSTVRLARALARGLALQIAIYGLERRVGPPSAAALRAAYPCLVTPAPYFILGHRLSTARSPHARSYPRRGNGRAGGK